MDCSGSAKLVTALRTHSASGGASFWACRALRALALDCAGRAAVIADGGPDTALDSLEASLEDAALQAVRHVTHVIKLRPRRPRRPRLGCACAIPRLPRGRRVISG